MTLRAASLEKLPCHVDFLHISSIALFKFLVIYLENGAIKRMTCFVVFEAFFGRFSTFLGVRGGKMALENSKRQKFHFFLKSTGMMCTKFWNAEGETGTFPLTCTLYKPVLIAIPQTSTVYLPVRSSATYFGLPRASPVSPFCLYVCMSAT